MLYKNALRVLERKTTKNL